MIQTPGFSFVHKIICWYQLEASNFFATGFHVILIIYAILPSMGELVVRVVHYI